MKRFQPLVLATALLLTSSMAGTAGAVSARLPASLYPAVADITYRSTVSNHAMDCLWGFFCEGSVPLFHNTTQADLNRTDGWAQFAGVHRNGRLAMSFELFASRYGTGTNDADVPWAGAALADFQTALQAHRYDPLRNAPRLVARGLSSAQVAERTDQGDIVVMAAWNGRNEVEAVVAFYRASPVARRAAVSLLARQVRQALDVTSRSLT